VERACAEQGVPVKITDPLVLAEIADILRAGCETRITERGSSVGRVFGSPLTALGGERDSGVLPMVAGPPCPMKEGAMRSALRVLGFLAVLGVPVVVLAAAAAYGGTERSPRLRPVIAAPVTTPGRPQAGKPVTVVFRVVRSDTHKPLTTGRLVCAASYGGGVIDHSGTFRGGIVRVSFVVPLAAAGQAVRVKVTVTASGASATRTATFSVFAAEASFSFARQLSGPPQSLRATAVSVDPRGAVTINGVDTRRPTIPFTFSWGDGTTSQAWFPASHSYADTTRNYVVRVTAHYSATEQDFVDAPVRFRPSALTPVPYPASLAVTIPNHGIALGTTEPGLRAPLLSYFDDSFFTWQPRATVEYVLSQAAAVQSAILEGDHALVDGAFQQVILRDPAVTGGAYSLWFASPVAVGSGDAFFGGSIGYSSMFHEIAHNLTLNAPARFRYGGKIDGNANAVYSETVAQIFQHVTAYELVNNAATYGIPPDLAADIAASAEDSMRGVRAAYDDYLLRGKPFATWNDPATSADETFGTFMTVAYVFLRHAEAVHNYVAPLRWTMRLLRTFDAADLAQYAPASNTPAASAFRATLLVAAVSYGFAEDLRGEFRDLGFPVDDAAYDSLISGVA
jgi:hypothetical protein